MEYIVGIDLGNTNSVISIMGDGNLDVMKNSEGSKTTPSIVAFSQAGDLLVGETAKLQAIYNPKNTVGAIKRHLGTNYKFKVNSKQYSPEVMTAMIFKKLKNDVEKYLSIDEPNEMPPMQAILTVPAYFTSSQCQAIKDAGAIAGFEVLRTISEPMAAAISYGLDKSDKLLNVLIFNLGGTTFEVSLLEIGRRSFEIKSTSYDTNLGGNDWDNEVVNWLIKDFKNTHGIDLKNDNMAQQRIKEAAEKAKIELSSVLQTNINLPFIAANSSGPKTLDINLTREIFEKLTCHLVERLKKPIQQVMKDARIETKDIDKILLVGGSTHMPMIANYIRNIFSKEPNKDINPDECIALGAAIQGFYGIRHI